MAITEDDIIFVNKLAVRMWETIPRGMFDANTRGTLSDIASRMEATPETLLEILPEIYPGTSPETIPLAAALGAAVMLLTKTSTGSTLIISPGEAKPVLDMAKRAGVVV